MRIRYQFFIKFLILSIAATLIIVGCQVKEITGEKDWIALPSTPTIVAPTHTNTPFSTEPVLPSVTPTPVPSLRTEVQEQNFWIGTAIDPAWFDESSFAELLSREYNMLTPEVAMKWEVIHPTRDYYDFRRGDQVTSFARLNGMLVRGHPLVWDKQLPEWLTEAEGKNLFTREEWIEILRGHVMTVAGHFRGQVYAWDVVNEAIDEDGTLRDTIWLRTIGPEYILLAFRWAHEADPYALLFYNDNGGEGVNAKSNGIYALVNGLLLDGIPIHGVGLQMHTSLENAPSREELAANLDRLAELGLRIHITEMDVRVQNSTASEEEKLSQQAEIYGRVFEVCYQNPMCEAFVVWGATDRQSWIPGYTGNPDMPLLFDEDGKPKPAYQSIMQILQAQERQ